MSSSNPIRTTLTIIMDVLIVLAIALTVRLVVLFFGALSSQGWGEAIVTATGYVTIPFGIDGVKTPYGGVFEIAGALTIVVLLLAEWVLSVARTTR